jgi:hypothetical protein
MVMACHRHSPRGADGIEEGESMGENGRLEEENGGDSGGVW